MKAKDLNQEAAPSPRPAKKAKIAKEPVSSCKLAAFPGTDFSSEHQGSHRDEQGGAAQVPREPPRRAAAP